jgi:hypothetical protein
VPHAALDLAPKPRRLARASPLNARQAIEGALEIRNDRGQFIGWCGLSASSDRLFCRQRVAAKPQKAANCLRFAATRLKFAATLGASGAPFGHAP